MSVKTSLKAKFKQASYFWKGVLIFILILVLLIPMAMVNDLMRERQYRSSDVAQSISQQWSGSQTGVGPILTVKYKHYYGDRGKFYTKQYHLMPEQLDMDINLEPEERKRGLFKTVVYRALGSVSGYYDLSDLKKRFNDNMEIDSLIISVGIKDKRGISEQILMNVNDVEHDMQSITHSNIFSSGIEAALDKAVLRKDRSSNTLPDARSISDTGFTSSWNVLSMNHSLPKIWEQGDLNLYNINNYYVGSTEYRGKGSHSLSPSSSSQSNLNGFGVQLIIPANAYQQSERSAKYAILFIGLTFLAFFIAEVMNKSRVHPLQYMLIGLSLIMFYTLLVSFSEHLGFGVAYLIASIAVTLLISGYAKAILKSQKLAKVIFGLLSGLYIYLYVLLQLESYALLMGSIGLFVILATVMYLTRDIDWYQNTSKLKQPSSGYLPWMVDLPFRF